VTTRLECISGALAAVVLAGFSGCEPATPGQHAQIQSVGSMKPVESAPPSAAPIRDAAQTPAAATPAASSATPAATSATPAATSATPTLEDTTPAANSPPTSSNSASEPSSRNNGHHADRDSRERAER